MLKTQALVKRVALTLVDIINTALTPSVATIVKQQLKAGPVRLRWTYKLWDYFHITPVAHHYYQPIFDPHKLPAATWDREDPLYGIDMNMPGQLDLLAQFHYNDELDQMSVDQPSDRLQYYYKNGFFEAGDAEILYNMIRHFKPQNIIEIGSGMSTRLTKAALGKNGQEGVSAKHICIDPFENPWLEDLGVDRVIRSRVEDMDTTLFQTLGENDILFIDSSHVLRTQGDVFVEFLRIIPTLKSGVLIHVHDIFFPFDYPKEQFTVRHFWTEQYLLQAFLAFNSAFEVLIAVNYLAHHHREALLSVCPVLACQHGRIPGSFWMRRT